MVHLGGVVRSFEALLGWRLVTRDARDVENGSLRVRLAGNHVIPQDSICGSCSATSHTHTVSHARDVRVTFIMPPTLTRQTESTSSRSCSQKGTVALRAYPAFQLQYIERTVLV